MEIETIKVKPWGEGQGDHVVINKADFDPKTHELFEPVEQEAAEPAKRGRKVKQEAGEPVEQEPAGNKAE